MATISNIGLQGNWNVSNAKKENMINSRKVLEVNFNSSHQNNDTLNNHNKRRFSLVITNSNHGSTFHKVDTINGTKVNGLQVVEAPKKLLNENTTDVALVTNGRFVEGRFVFRQIFVIRSYEIGPDRTATMETLMNFLQVSFIVLVPTLMSTTIFKHCFLCHKYNMKLDSHLVFFITTITITHMINRRICCFKF